MALYRGKHRYVFISGRFVFKTPKCNLAWLRLAWMHLKEFIFLSSHLRNVGRLVQLIFFLKNLMRFFWSGVVENVNEAICYYTARARGKDKLLATLWLPLIVVNVYHREDGVGNFLFDSDGLCEKISRDSGYGDKRFLHAVVRCHHTFDRRSNFSFDGKQVKILDYGQKGVLHLIMEHERDVEELLLSVATP